jgi:DNA (cytosine-5)-methyltransferase 1
MLKLLDLYCGAGGASVGYSRAGFEVTGVDKYPQPRYPFEFIQGDAIDYCLNYGHRFDIITASPPCQAYTCLKSILTEAQKAKHEDLIDATRDAILSTGKPYVIENVGGARNKLRSPIMLCGTYFGLKVYRHRFFECNPFVLCPSHFPHQDNLQGSGRGLSDKGFISVTGNGGDRTLGSNYFSYAQRSMGIDWMSRKELSQAIPPAYTEFIGNQIMQVLTVAASTST